MSAVPDQLPVARRRWQSERDGIVITVKNGQGFVFRPVFVDMAHLTHQSSLLRIVPLLLGENLTVF